MSDGHATSHSAAKRHYTVMARAEIPASQPMGRSGAARDDRQRWHILQHGAPVCGVRTAGEIDWHAPYLAVQDKLICKRCHGRFSWRPVAHDVEYVDLGHTTPCKVWKRGTQGAGYGSRGLDGRNKLTHREAYEAVHGEIPAGFVLHHHCGEKTCLEVDHMEAMSRAEHCRLHRPGDHRIYGGPRSA